MACPRPRVAQNGDLIYPERGPLPPTPEGYTRDEANKRVMHPIYPTCSHRSFTSLPTPCGRKNYHYYCDKSGTLEYVNFFACSKCTDPKSQAGTIAQIEKAIGGEVEK